MPKQSSRIFVFLLITSLLWDPSNAISTLNHANGQRSFASPAVTGRVAFEHEALALPLEASPKSFGRFSDVYHALVSFLSGRVDQRILVPAMSVGNAEIPWLGIYFAKRHRHVSPSPRGKASPGRSSPGPPWRPRLTPKLLAITLVLAFVAIPAVRMAYRWSHPSRSAETSVASPAIPGPAPAVPIAPPPPAPSEKVGPSEKPGPSNNFNGFTPIFLKWINRSLRELYTRPKVSQTDREAFLLFARTAEKHLEFTDAVEGPRVKIHLTREGAGVKRAVRIDFLRLRPLVERSARGDKEAHDQLIDCGLRAGRLLQENGDVAFFRFLDNGQEEVRRIAPETEPYYAALRTAVDRWGVDLAVDPYAGPLIGGVKPAASPEAPGGLSLIVIFNYESFRGMAMFPGKNAPLKRTVALGLLVKEGGGAADMLARPRAYLATDALGTKLRKQRFNGNEFDPSNADHIRQALQDPAYMGMVYEYATRLTYGEAAGYEPLLPFFAAARITSSETLLPLDSPGAKPGVALLVGGFHNFLMDVQDAPANERSFRVRSSAFVLDVLPRLPQAQLILYDLRQKRLLNVRPGNKFSDYDDGFRFLMNRGLTHENDDRPFPAPSPGGMGSASPHSRKVSRSA